MTKKGREFNEIYDLTAMRVIVDSVKDCYGAVGVIHSLWKPLPGRFKDFIAMPKFNMYQSLHTTVIGPEGLPLEIQIRTREMHDMAEYGVAAHWIYKQDPRRPRAARRAAAGEGEDKLKWLRSMLDWQQELQDPKEFMENLKVDLFDEEVFVFTPKGEVKSLAAGATPLDFAYEVHTEIGHRCVGAKVNGKIVPLHYELKSGDIVEILTSKRDRGPSRDWIAMVQDDARAQQDQGLVQGRVARGHRAHRPRAAAGAPHARTACPRRRSPARRCWPTSSARWASAKADDFYIALGGAKISPKVVVNKVLQRLKQGEAAEEETTAVESLVSTRPPAPPADRAPRSAYGIVVEGVDDVLLRMAKCCRPVPGDPIVGYVSLGRGITIHRDDCPNAAALRKDPERFVPRALGGRPRRRPSRSSCRSTPGTATGCSRTSSRTFAEAGHQHRRGALHRQRRRWSRTASSSRSATRARSRRPSRKLRNIDGVFDAYRVTPGAG